MANFPSSPAIFIKTANGRYTFISPGGASLFGLKEKFFIGKTDIDIFGPEIGFDSLEIEQRVLTTGQSHITNTCFLINEEECLIQISRHLYQADEESGPGIIGIFEPQEGPKPKSPEDVSVLAEVQEELPAQTENLPSTIETINKRLLILSTAVASITTSLNQDHILESLTWELTNLLKVESCVVYQWDKESDCLTHLSVYSENTGMLVRREDISLKEYPALKRLMEERTPKQYNPQQLHGANQNTLPLSFTQRQSLLLPLVFHENIYGLVHIESLQSENSFSDQDISISQLLTDQAAGALTNAWLYEALNVANKSLKATNEELDAFGHTVAHDLKSPLGTIIGFADFVVKEYTKLSEAEIQEFLGFIATNGHKMRRIIDALLTLASIRRQEVQFTQVDMKAVMTEVQSRLQYTLLENNVEIMMSNSLPNGVGYMPWIEEVWVNYITNALKYGGDPPEITIGAKKLDDGMIRYWVRDNGRGLSPEDQKKLFIPFSRLGYNDATGHGLGLSIVQRIITRLGGTVGVVSKVGEGCEFYFTLPAEISNV